MLDITYLVEKYNEFTKEGEVEGKTWNQFFDFAGVDEEDKDQITINLILREVMNSTEEQQGHKVIKTLENTYTFNGGYDRVGKFWVEKAKCTLCSHDDENCLCIDASEGEYNTFCVCDTCANIILKSKGN